MADELLAWMGSFENQLDEETFQRIYDTLKANFFTTRLKIKLIKEDALNMMFQRHLPLGTMALLTYQLQLLRDESPLVYKSSKSRQYHAETESQKAQASTSSKEPAKKNVLKALRFEEQKLLDQIRRAKEEIQEIETNMESMDIQVKEPPRLGVSKIVCGHCHHRGHRNQSLNACKYDKCSDYTYCGIREKHPEYFSKLNSLKTERKKKKDALNELESQLKSMQQFSSSSEHQFIKNLTPRLYKVDETYKKNKPKLMRDIRLIRDQLGGKIPPECANDEEQLKLLLRKTKKGLAISDEDGSSDAASLSSTSESSDSSSDRKRRKSKKHSKRKRSKKSPELPVVEGDVTCNYPYHYFNSPLGGPGNTNPRFQFPNHPLFSQFSPTHGMYHGHGLHYMMPPFQGLPINPSTHTVTSTNTNNHYNQVSLGSPGNSMNNKVDVQSSHPFGDLNTLAEAATDIRYEEEYTA